MVSRRAFLEIGATGAVFLPVALISRSQCARETAAPFYKAIFDERFPASIAFAQDLNRRGVPVHGIRGDITALWYHDLYFQWKKGPAPIDGVTTSESLFCLELLARDAGLRVTRRQELGDGLVSWSIGRRQTSSRADDMRQVGSWI